MRYSRQRELVLEQVLGRSDHPTADDIYQSVRSVCPNLSLGTVYRNLNGLAERGDIRRVAVPGHADRFDRTVGPHSHMYCQRCGRLLDAPLPEQDMKEFLNRQMDFFVQDYSLTLFGVCHDCQQPT